MAEENCKGAFDPPFSIISAPQSSLGEHVSHDLRNTLSRKSCLHFTSICHMTFSTTIWRRQQAFCTCVCVCMQTFCVLCNCMQH